MRIEKTSVFSLAGGPPGCGAAQRRHNSPTAQQPNSPTATTAQQHNSTTAQQHNSTTAQQHGALMPRGAKATGPRIALRPLLAAALAFAAIALSSASTMAAAAIKPPTKLHTAPKSPLPPKLPLNVVLAQVPWKRDSDHPVKEFVPLATLPWKRYFTHPVPEFVPLATLPWANCHVVHLALPHAPQRWGVPDCHFIMAICRDQQGNLWFATEGGGIYRYTPSASKGKHWTQFTKQNTHGALENNCIYAIACDNHNRIWVGELNHGVGVFNGKQWQDYDIVQNPKHHVLAGPLGDHVFAMKFDRYTDQMWIGTNAGLTVYQCGKTLRAENKTASRAARNAVRSRSHTSRAVYPLGTSAEKLSDGINPITSGLVFAAWSRRHEYACRCACSGSRAQCRFIWAQRVAIRLFV